MKFRDLETRLVKSHGPGCECRDDLSKVMPRTAPPRWSSTKTLYTELLAALNGCSIPNLVSAIAQTKALKATAWPEFKTACERLRQLQDLQQELMHAEESCTIEMLESVISRARKMRVVGDWPTITEQWPQFAVVQHRLHKLLDLKANLVEASVAPVPSIEDCVAILAQASEVGVYRWPEVRLLEERLQNLKAVHKQLLEALECTTPEDVARAIQAAEAEGLTEEWPQLGSAFGAAKRRLECFMRLRADLTASESSVEVLTHTLLSVCELGLENWPEVGQAVARLTEWRANEQALLSAVESGSILMLRGVIQSVERSEAEASLQSADPSEGQVAGGALPSSNIGMARRHLEVLMQSKTIAESPEPGNSDVGTPDDDDSSKCQPDASRLDKLQELQNRVSITAKGSDIASLESVIEQAEALGISDNWPQVSLASKRLAALKQLEEELTSASSSSSVDDLLAAISRAEALGCNEWIAFAAASNRLSVLRSLDSMLLSAVARASPDALEAALEQASATGASSLAAASAAQGLLHQLRAITPDSTNPKDQRPDSTETNLVDDDDRSVLGFMEGLQLLKVETVDDQGEAGQASAKELAPCISKQDEGSDVMSHTASATDGSEKDFLNATASKILEGSLLAVTTTDATALETPSDPSDAVVRPPASAADSSAGKSVLTESDSPEYIEASSIFRSSLEAPIEPSDMVGHQVPNGRDDPDERCILTRSPSCDTPEFVEHAAAAVVRSSLNFCNVEAPVEAAQAKPSAAQPTQMPTTAQAPYRATAETSAAVPGDLAALSDTCISDPSSGPTQVAAAAAKEITEHVVSDQKHSSSANTGQAISGDEGTVVETVHKSTKGSQVSEVASYYESGGSAVAKEIMESVQVLTQGEGGKGNAKPTKGSQVSEVVSCYESEGSAVAKEMMEKMQILRQGERGKGDAKSPKGSQVSEVASCYESEVNTVAKEMIESVQILTQGGGESDAVESSALESSASSGTNVAGAISSNNLDLMLHAALQSLTTDLVEASTTEICDSSSGVDSYSEEAIRKGMQIPGIAVDQSPSGAVRWSTKEAE